MYCSLLWKPNELLKENHAVSDEARVVLRILDPGGLSGLRRSYAGGEQCNNGSGVAMLL